MHPNPLFQYFGFYGLAFGTVAIILFSLSGVATDR